MVSLVSRRYMRVVNGSLKILCCLGIPVVHEVSGVVSMKSLRIYRIRNRYFIDVKVEIAKSKNELFQIS